LRTGYHLCENEALKRYPDYEELSDGTLTQIEGKKEFRIYCNDVEGCPFGVITSRFCSMLYKVGSRHLAGDYGTSISS
jgi:hypothetical protein